MRHIFYIITLLIITESCSSPYKSDLERMGVTAKIKTIVDTIYYAEEKFGIPEETSIKHIYINDYDEQGFIKATSLLGAYEDLKAKYIPKRFEDNRIKEYNYYTPKGELYAKAIYTYEDKTYTMRVNHYYKDSLEQRDVSLCNKDWQPIETVIYRDGKESKYTYKYQPNGDLIEWSALDSAGKLEFRYTYYYDPHKKYFLQKYYDSDNKLVSIDSSTLVFSDRAVVIESTKWENRELSEIKKSHVEYY